MRNNEVTDSFAHAVEWKATIKQQPFDRRKIVAPRGSNLGRRCYRLSGENQSSLVIKCNNPRRNRSRVYSWRRRATRARAAASPRGAILRVWLPARIRS